MPYSSLLLKLINSLILMQIQIIYNLYIDQLAPPRKLHCWYDISHTISWPCSQTSHILPLWLWLPIFKDPFLHNNIFTFFLVDVGFLSRLFFVLPITHNNHIIQSYCNTKFIWLKSTAMLLCLFLFMFSLFDDPPFIIFDEFFCIFNDWIKIILVFIQFAIFCFCPKSWILECPQQL